MMDELWNEAKKRAERLDAEQAHALGFDRCQQCGEWFHMANDDWGDCVRCGRHCPACAAEVGWTWCDRCGFHYCQNCVDGDDFLCDVCQILV